MASTRLLIVDDILQVRQELHNLLALDDEIEIVGEAANGSEALAQAGRLQPDVILMDMEMPVMSGYEATYQIKSSYPACRVIALTLHSYPAARERALQSGVDQFIEKGAPLETLVQAILNKLGVNHG